MASGGGPVVGIIGVGAIAAAIVEGIMRNSREIGVVLSPRGAEKATALAARFPAVEVASDNQAVVDRCNVVLICVRPRDADAVLTSLRFRAEQTVISAMAGVRLSTLRQFAGPAEICRAIPLPAVAQGQDPTPIFPAVKAARTLFDRLGGTIEPDDEAQFDALSAVTGTIAAHVTYLATIADWLADEGVDRTIADRYVAGIFATLDLAPSVSEPLRGLARHHATPGGINEAFAAHLASAGLKDAVREGLAHILGRTTGQA